MKNNEVGGTFGDLTKGGLGNFELTKMLLTSMAGSENHFTVNMFFVKFMGELEGGVFLSQLIFWSDKGGRSDGWFYKRAVDWESECGLKRRALERNEKKLIKLGILDTRNMKVNGSPTKHYKLNLDALLNEIRAYVNRTNGNVTSDKSEMYERTNGNVTSDISSITESTTEITKHIVADKSDDARTVILGSQGEKKSKPKATRYNFEEQDMVLAKLLLQYNQRDDDKAKANLESWANTARLMRERDGRTFDEIKDVMTWAKNDEFWRANIMSMPKLRKQMTQLIAQMKRGGRNGKSNKPDAHKRVEDLPSTFIF